MIKKIGWWIDAICQRYKLIRKLKKISLLVPMQSALNAWKIPTFADCFFNLCLFVLFENFGCKNLKHTIFEPLKLLFSLL